MNRDYRGRFHRPGIEVRFDVVVTDSSKLDADGLSWLSRVVGVLREPGPADLAELAQLTAAVDVPARPRFDPDRARAAAADNAYKVDR